MGFIGPQSQRGRRLRSYETPLSNPSPGTQFERILLRFEEDNAQLQLCSKLELRLGKLSPGSSPWEGEQFRSFFN